MRSLGQTKAMVIMMINNNNKTRTERAIQRGSRRVANDGVEQGLKEENTELLVLLFYGVGVGGGGRGSGKGRLSSI